MQTKLKKWTVAAAVLAALAAIGVTLAFMFKKTDIIKNLFYPAKVSCSVYEKLDGSEVTGVSEIGSEKSEIRVQNTGTVDEYLRVRLISYFVNADGTISGAEPSVYPEITLNSGWIEGKDHTYYYTKPVNPGDFTELPLCQPFVLSEKVVWDSTIQSEKTIYQVVEVFAEAIQANPASAATKAWSVTVENGTITSAP